MATRTTTSYTRHRRQAAVRRRRIVLLLVLATALVIVGGAMAWPRGENQPQAAVVMVVAKPKAKQPAKQPTEKPAAAAAAAAVGAAAAPSDASASVDPSVEWPDWKPTPQAQKAIDTALANGRPPQFLVSSFDGAADIEMYNKWLPVAKSLGARFSFFVSGIYMLLPENKDAYKPPHEPQGFSNLGGYAELAGSKSAEQNIRDNWAAFNEARMMGNEIGSHYVGHICEQSDAWTTADWVSEESQWEQFMLNVNQVNNLNPPVSQVVTHADFHGGRTPCLNGNKTNLYAAMKQMGYEYDASQAGILGQWPKKQQGLWSFPLPSIPRAGTKYDTLAMDYNFYFNQGTTTDPATAEQDSKYTYQSYIGAFNKLYHSNRAPLILGSHFANWNMGAYNRALKKTLEKACTTPEVACVDFITLARWLDQQPAGQIAKWEAGTFSTS